MENKTILEFEPHIDINSVSDVEAIMTDMIDDFCDDLANVDGMCRKLTEQEKEEFDEDVDFVWTDNALKSIEGESARLISIAKKYYHDEEFIVSTNRILD